MKRGGPVPSTEPGVTRCEQKSHKIVTLSGERRGASRGPGGACLTDAIQTPIAPNLLCFTPMIAVDEKMGATLDHPARTAGRSFFRAQTKIVHREDEAPQGSFDSAPRRSAQDDGFLGAASEKRPEQVTDCGTRSWATFTNSQLLSDPSPRDSIGRDVAILS